MVLAEEIGKHGRHVIAENPGGAGPFVILCDHASKVMPPSYRGLGLSEEQMVSHIAWDPGALPVARILSERLDAPLLWPDVSRLIIDCNRAHDAPDLIPQKGEGRPIPGNRDLSPDERRNRIERFHEPYHRAIGDLVTRRTGKGLSSALVAVHSYTPVFFGTSRPWPVGIIFDRDRSLADQVIKGLQADAALNVGVNEPYSPDDGVYYTLRTHGDECGLASVMIEIRNDEITDADQCALWADRLAGILSGATLPEISASP